MGLISVLVPLLMPPAMLGGLMAMGRYEDYILPRRDPGPEPAARTAPVAARSEATAPAAPATAESAPEPSPRSRARHARPAELPGPVRLRPRPVGRRSHAAPAAAGC
ncbi:hypothetical protein [Streptomyces sp. NPDC046887]|uniref:hypothetical protein n=1 Tax=Streptomyces sp. NPDC046887 TaxID=3155472 RepID=UPI0033F7787A